jgi:hypothetical protein
MKFWHYWPLTKPEVTDNPMLKEVLMPNTVYDYTVYHAENALANETRIYNNMQNSPYAISDYSYEIQTENIQDAENSLIEARLKQIEHCQATGEISANATEGSTYATLSSGEWVVW